jgi:hypothetical protein
MNYIHVLLKDDYYFHYVHYYMEYFEDLLYQAHRKVHSERNKIGLDENHDVGNY